MPAFRFIGDPRCGGHGPESIALFGHVFNRTDWTEVEGDTADRCARHSHLEARQEPVAASALYVRCWATHDDEPIPEAAPEPKKRGRPRKAS